jgi:hypothetical protein
MPSVFVNTEVVVNLVAIARKLSPESRERGAGAHDFNHQNGRFSASIPAEGTVRC